MFLSFSGNVTFNAGSVGIGSSGNTQGAGGPQAREASTEGTRGGRRAPGRKQGPRLLFPGWTRSERTWNKKFARPTSDVDAPKLRKDAALREMAAYMKEAAPKNDSKFVFLQYLEGRGTRMG